MVLVLFFSSRRRPTSLRRDWSSDVCSSELRSARGGVVVRGGLPSGWGRLTSEIPLAIAGMAPIQISADGHETRDHHLYGELEVRHAPGGILDVAVHVQRRDTGHHAAVKLTGVGLPGLIDNQAATIPAGSDSGYKIGRASRRERV